MSWRSFLAGIAVGVVLTLVAEFAYIWWVTSGHSCGGPPGSCWP